MYRDMTIMSTGTRFTVVLRLKVTPLCTRSAQGLSLVSTTSSLASSLE